MLFKIRLEKNIKCELWRVFFDDTIDQDHDDMKSMTGRSAECLKMTGRYASEMYKIK